jgi:hypothetical protein
VSLQDAYGNAIVDPTSDDNQVWLELRGTLCSFVSDGAIV